MSDRAREEASGATGSFDVDMLTDNSLLCQRSVLGYLGPDEQLQFLFMNRNQGFRAAKLKDPNVADDFDSGEDTDKSPEGDYAAVMAVTSDCIHFLIGQSDDDQRFSVPLEEVTAVRRETNQGVVSIAFRNSTLKFVFTPTSSDNLDEAVQYIQQRIRTASSETTANAEPTYKYSTTSVSRDLDVGPRREMDTSSGPRLEAEANASEPSTDDWNWVEDAKEDSPTEGPEQTRQPEASGGTQESQGRASDRTTAESSDTLGTTDGVDDADDDEETAAIDGELEPSETVLPQEVRDHLRASRDVFDGIESPFTQPDAGYAAAVKAYSELCQALNSLPPNEFAARREEIQSQLTELETLVELLDEYGRTLTTAQTLVERPNGEREKFTDEDTNFESLTDGLAELQSATSELTIDTEPIETLRLKLQNPEHAGSDEQPDDDQSKDQDGQSDLDSHSDSDSDADKPSRIQEGPVQPTEPVSDAGGSQSGDGPSPKTADEHPSPDTRTHTVSERTERVTHHLFIDADATQSERVIGLLYELTEELERFDIRTANLTDAKEVLSTLESALTTVETEDGVKTRYVPNILERIEVQHEAVKRLLDVLRVARRKLRIAEEYEHTYFSDKELAKLREQLHTAVGLAEHVGRDTDPFRALASDVEELLDDADLQPLTSDTDPDIAATDDQPSRIRPNEISEWYDAVRNLKHVTTAIKRSIDELDAPMREWCNAVDQFVTDGRGDHPCYAELQQVQNDFEMTEYRERYGNSERTTEFHTVEVEPLSETVRTLLSRISDEPIDDVYLPITPESKVRLPVIVETPAELARAVGLLEELPVTFDLKRATDEVDETGDSPAETNLEGDLDTDARESTETDPSDTISEVPDESREDEEDSDRGDSSDTPDSVDAAPLTDLGGVTPPVADALYEAGITTKEQLVSTELSELADIDGVGMAIAQRIKMQVG